MFYEEHLIEEIRQQNDIVEVIGAYIKLKKKGSYYMGLCPFHAEKTPSFSVNPTKQLYHCFGCGAAGSVYTFLMEYEHYTFLEAIEVLASRAGIALPAKSGSKEEQQKESQKAQLFAIQKQAAQYFYRQWQTKAGMVALQYLQKRNLTQATIKRFGLGYAGKSKDQLYQYLKKCGYSDDILKQTGLVSIEEKGAYDIFFNRVMFPIFNLHQKVIAFGGRVMGEAKPKYLNSKETLIFEKRQHLYGLQYARMTKEDTILLCEGYMDVITLHQAGFTNAVASLGTALTSYQAKLLKRYTDCVTLVYDSDLAGQKATLRAIPILREADLSVKVMSLAPYKDPDECIKEIGSERFSTYVKRAQNSFYYEVACLQKNYVLEDPDQKTRFYHALAKKLLLFQEPLERENYIQAVARQYRINEKALKNLVEQYGIRGEMGSKERQKETFGEKTIKQTEKSAIEDAQKMLLTWLSNDITLFKILEDILGPEDFEKPFYYQIAMKLFDQYQTEKQVMPLKIIHQFSEEKEQQKAVQAFQAELPEDLTKKEKEKILYDLIYRIKQFHLEEQKKQATEFSVLQKIMQQQMKLQKLHISL